MTTIARDTQHYMPLHVLPETMQIHQQQVVGAHQVAHLQHYSPKLLIVPRYRRPLPQVKQMGLVAEGMMQVAELSLQGMAKILPCTNAQSSPVFIRYQLPPGQGLSHEQGDSHLDNFRRLHYTRHLTKLLDIERPIRQLLGIPIELVRLL